MEISDVISSISLAVTIIGLAFAFFQWRKSNSIKRAEYINELTEKVRSDEDIRAIVYRIDYNEDWYTAGFHGSGELEVQVDKTLSYFSYICYLKSMKVVSKKEFSFFEYKINRILKDNNVQRYLFNLYHFSRKDNTSISFNYLLEYGKEKKLLTNDFFNKDSKQYQDYKYLYF